MISKNNVEMNHVLYPWHLLFLIFAGWVNRQQQQVIDYLVTENRVLREKCGGGRILLNDDQRRRLAVKGKVLGRKLLRKIETLFSPDTILRWHRQLVAQKWDHNDKRNTVGRPRIRQEIVDLTLRFARENPTWGYDRIRDALANVGYRICDSTVRNILKAHGIEPSGDRRRTGSWSEFLQAHWDTLAAIDFTTCEVWSKNGLVTMYILVVMELKTRRVSVAGVTTNPNTEWITQVTRELTNAEDGFLKDTTHLIVDRDKSFIPLQKYLEEFTSVKPVLLPPKSPNLNSHIERFFRSLKSECLERMIFFGEKPLRQALSAFVQHYHAERNHQGLDGRIIEPGNEVGQIAGKIHCHKRLGGMLKYYHRDAA